MGRTETARTESSAVWTGQSSPVTGSRVSTSECEPQDFELADLALAYGARPPTFLSASFLDTVSSFSQQTIDRDARECAASAVAG